MTIAASCLHNTSQFVLDAGARARAHTPSGFFGTVPEPPKSSRPIYSTDMPMKFLNSACFTSFFSYPGDLESHRPPSR